MYNISDITGMDYSAYQFCFSTNITDDEMHLQNVGSVAKFTLKTKAHFLYYLLW